MANKLESLKKVTTVVSDTGDIHAIQQFAPQDATTNPSLILAASQEEAYQFLIDEAVRFGLSKHADEKLTLTHIMDKLFVNFGCEILKIVPGRVSTEVDARLSFDVEGSIHKAIHLIDLYESMGIERNRVLIKLASTWEGAKAAHHLEKEGIHCNMTLMFDLSQAIICAEAGATLISPFVGRILDWYKAAEKKESYPPAQDPGVISVGAIYNYYKKFNYKTQVMGASFRNAGEILELAGCDLLTISPQFLDELQKMPGSVDRKLDPASSKKMDIAKIEMDEKHFRWMLNENAMATEKLSEGIRKFTQDQRKLEKYVLDKVSSLHKI